MKLGLDVPLIVSGRVCMLKVPLSRENHCDFGVRRNNHWGASSSSSKSLVKLKFPFNGNRSLLIVTPSGKEYSYFISFPPRSKTGQSFSHFTGAINVSLPVL